MSLILRQPKEHCARTNGRYLLPVYGHFVSDIGSKQSPVSILVFGILTMVRALSFSSSSGFVLTIIDVDLSMKWKLVDKINSNLKSCMFGKIYFQPDGMAAEYLRDILVRIKIF